MARFVFGLFLPAIHEDMTITSTMVEVNGVLPFLSFAFAILAAHWVMRRSRVRHTAVPATTFAGIGLVTTALASVPLMQTTGVLICAISTGLSSPVMIEAVHRIVRGSATFTAANFLFQYKK